MNPIIYHLRSEKSPSILFLILLVAGFLSVSFNVKAQPNDKALVSQGAALYTQYCSGCHGVKMEAFVNKGWKHGTSEQEIRISITNGWSQGAMPAWGELLDQQQIGDLVAYLREGFDNLSKYDLAEEEIDLSTVFESSDLKFMLEAVADGFQGPWGMAFLGDGSLLVTEKEGKLYQVNSEGEKVEIRNAPQVNNDGQGGLLDIALHPKYDENNWIYLSYSISKKENDDTVNTTAVSRYQLKGDQLVDEKLIFEGLPYSGTRHHYGSRLVFDNDGYLFITIGDRGARDVNPQRLDLFPGKVHRVNDDGTIPADNPFVDQPGAIKSIYSYGHRNPQGMAKNPATGEIWAHEHGPRGGDELNLIQKGANYGWPKVSFGINYNGTTFTAQTEADGFAAPIHYWVPSIAPSGMDFVSSDAYPGWEGHLLLGSLKFQYLNLCKLEGNKVVNEEILMKGVGRVRNVKQAPDGFIYVAVEDPGKIFRLVPVE